MPVAEVTPLSHYAELEAMGSAADRFFHYFVSVDEVMSGAAFFLRRQHKTIVLIHGAEAPHLPRGFYTLNVCQPEPDLMRAILSLARGAHGGTADGAEAHARHTPGEAPQVRLTPREREVLKGIVEGLINKEIAARMGISTATVITHRNNLTEKLGTRSVSALTIFAVMHGIVKGELLQ